MPAGSKPGERRGGRQKGTRNHASIAREKRVSASGIAPLDFLLEVMRNPENPRDVRIDAAKAAAPYVHPKLASLQSSVAVSGRLTLEQLVASSMRIGAPPAEKPDDAAAT